jgi:hypothetical protein
VPVVRTTIGEAPASATPFTPSTSVPASNIQAAIENVQQTANSVASCSSWWRRHRALSPPVTTDSNTITWITPTGQGQPGERPGLRHPRPDARDHRAGALRALAGNLEPDPGDLLVPFPAEPLTMWPISTRVNRPEHDDAGILERSE